MNKKYHYFFDLNEILIDRYPAKISKEILINDKLAKFVFIYSEKYGPDEPKNIPKGSKIIYMPLITEKTLYKIFDLYKPISITTIAHRIPDLLVTFLSNKKNIPTHTVQHGIWSDKIERISVLSALVSKFSKIKFYLINAYSLSKAMKINYIKSVFDAYRFFYKDNKKITEIKSLSNKYLRSKIVFAFDSSWNEYYLKKFNYKLNQIVYIGNPDLLLLNDKSLNKIENSVCYICQSLVEDGRYLFNDFQLFLSIIKSNIAEFKKVYIKLHPRTKIENYMILKNHKNIIFTNDFPICSHYIGHYSSLLLIARKVSSNVLIWELNNHYIPKNFHEYASVKTNSVDVLKNFISTENKNIVNSSVFRFENPYKLITNTLLKYEL
jgi:hypothetical protein